MSLSFLEQETVIVYNRAETEATVNTYDPALIRKLDAMSRIDQCVQQTQRGKDWAVYKIPKKYVKVVRPRQYTDEKRAELIARGKALQEKYKGGNNNAE